MLIVLLAIGCVVDPAVCGGYTPSPHGPTLIGPLAEPVAEPAGGGLHDARLANSIWSECCENPAAARKTTHDASGRAIALEVDRETHVFHWDGDGCATQAQSASAIDWTATCDEHGQPVTVDDTRFSNTYEGELLVQSDEDRLGDGLVDVGWAFTWDDEGHPTGRTGQSSQPDVPFEQTDTWTWHDGLLTSWHQDAFVAIDVGVPAWRSTDVTWTWAAGELLTRLEAHDDGTSEERTYLYPDQKVPLALGWWSLDPSGSTVFGFNAIECTCDDRDGDRACDDSDCEDADAAIFPGAIEVCDGIDNDCDGVVDDEVAVTSYPDEDGDGHGASERGTRGCERVPGQVVVGDDCDDTDADVFPGARDVDNGIDDDCDGTIDN